MKKSGKLRIIGGQWKRRNIRFPVVPGLRPTPDRARETLFNWLMNHLDGKTCLDLFAGSGALGFEAASRGAARVVMVESNRKSVQSLLKNRELLHAQSQVDIVHGQALNHLSLTPVKYDLVFMDPPFEQALIGPACQALVRYPVLQDPAWIYIESPISNHPLPIPATWNIIRESRCGMVQLTLAET